MIKLKPHYSSFSEYFFLLLMILLSYDDYDDTVQDFNMDYRITKHKEKIEYKLLDVGGTNPERVHYGDINNITRVVINENY